MAPEGAIEAILKAKQAAYAGLAGAKSY